MFAAPLKTTWTLRETSKNKQTTSHAKALERLKVHALRVCPTLGMDTHARSAEKQTAPKVAKGKNPQRVKSTLLSDNGKTTGTPPTGKTTALLQADVKTCNHNSMEQSKHREIQKIKNHLSHAQKNLIL